MELVKDSCRKLNDTNNKGKMVVPNCANPPGQVVVHALLLLAGAPNQWGAATTIGNPGQLPRNPPIAHGPAGGQPGQAPPGAAGLNVPAAEGNVPAAGQLGQAPPRAAGPNVPAAQVNLPDAGQLRQAPQGLAGPNVPAAGQLASLLPDNWASLQPDNSASLQPDNSASLLQDNSASLLPDTSASLLPDNSDRLLLVWLVQTSLLPDNSVRLLRVRLVQTYLLHKSTSLLPDSSDRLPQVMFLRRVRMYLFNLVMIVRTDKWYVI